MSTHLVFASGPPTIILILIYGWFAWCIGIIGAVLFVGWFGKPKMRLVASVIGCGKGGLLLLFAWSAKVNGSYVTPEFFVVESLTVLAGIIALHFWWFGARE